ncbi:hypothetical protein [Propionivibrio limicola]|uniref:hypothetical protein n=1 Tax=Propionivibrio limicola TaxID=167645 RepID=UPI00129124B4|nr:hypothetical protein [Propionivibrio limicola]
MWLMRLLAVLTAIGIAGSVLCYLFTNDRRYLRLASRLFRFTLIAVLLFFGLLILERVAVIPLVIPF